MGQKVFKAGKFIILFQLGSSIFLILFAIALGLIRGWSSALIPPLFLAIFILIRLYIKRKKPIFLISDNEVEIFNPPRKIPTEKIAAIDYVEEKKLELILTEGMSVPLFLHDLSKADRKDLKNRIETMINRVKHRSNKV
jgi:hypothetical protein